MITVLSTKSLPSETISYARLKGIELVCTDFIEIIPIKFDDSHIPALFDSVVFTSANAVKNFLLHADVKTLLANKKIFSISGKTLELLNANGYEAYSVADNSLLLGQLIVQSHTKAILHVCGNMKLNTLETELSHADIKYVPLVVYQTRAVKQPKLHIQPRAIMFYSPSGIDSFLDQNTIDPKTICCCIGHTTANALTAKLPAAHILVSTKPLAEAMIDTLADALKK
jgi:uroporphyrinogen-III synthase